MQEQEADVEDLLARELLAVDLRRRGTATGCRRAASLLALVEDRVEVRVDVLRRSGSASAALSSGVPLALSGRMMPSFMRRNVSELLPRQAHQPEEHRGGERHRELVGEVARAAVDEHVDEVVDPSRRCRPRSRPCASARTAGRASCGTSSGRAGRSTAGSAGGRCRATTRRPYADENRFGSRNASSTAARLAIMYAVSSMIRCTGPAERSW